MTKVATSSLSDVWDDLTFPVTTRSPVIVAPFKLTVDVVENGEDTTSPPWNSDAPVETSVPTDAAWNSALGPERAPIMDCVAAESFERNLNLSCGSDRFIVGLCQVEREKDKTKIRLDQILVSICRVYVLSSR